MAAMVPVISLCVAGRGPVVVEVSSDGLCEAVAAGFVDDFWIWYSYCAVSVVYVFGSAAVAGDLGELLVLLSSVDWLSSDGELVVHAR